MNPFISALSKKAGPKFQKETPKIAIDRPPRIFDTHHNEMPKLKGRAPGTKVRGRFEGKIHSVDEDGRVMLHVHKLTDDAANSNSDDQD